MRDFGYAALVQTLEQLFALHISKTTLTMQLMLLVNIFNTVIKFSLTLQFS